MNIQTIFIVDKRNKMLIFLGVLQEGLSLNQEELTKVLGTIAAKIAGLDINSTESLQINEKSYLFGNFEKIIIIIGFEGTDSPPKEILTELDKGFVGKFSALLENYSNEDIPKFKAFLEDARGILEKPLTPIPAPEKKEEPIHVEATPQIDEIGAKPLITPMERSAFPEGIADYQRDEILWNEAEMAKADYVAEYVEGMISQIKVFLSISLTHHYEIYIDFSEYPAKPKISIGAGLAEELGKSLDELLFFYRNWDTKIPPHVLEIIREFEAVLMKFKAQKKLSDTSEMPEAALPELEPLPDLPPLEEDEEAEPEPEPVEDKKEE